jgi:hypothetical protein
MTLNYYAQHQVRTGKQLGTGTPPVRYSTDTWYDVMTVPGMPPEVGADYVLFLYVTVAANERCRNSYGVGNKIDFPIGATRTKNSSQSDHIMDVHIIYCLSKAIDAFASWS